LKLFKLNKEKRKKNVFLFILRTLATRFVGGFLRGLILGLIVVLLVVVLSQGLIRPYIPTVLNICNVTK
jgi:hypothetical protein